MSLAWLENTRPDVVFKILQIAKVARAMYERDITAHWKRLNKATKYVSDRKSFIHIPTLDFSSLRITSYSESAFSNNVDLSSLPGRIVLVTDDIHDSVSVSYKPYKSRHVACFVLSAEVIVFVDLLDDAFAIRKE